MKIKYLIMGKLADFFQSWAQGNRACIYIKSKSLRICSQNNIASIEGHCRAKRFWCGRKTRKQAI